MPFRSTLTMARLEFCQLSIEVVLLAGWRFLRHYHNLASPIDFDTGDMHTRRGDGLDRPGDVLLPECGRRAGHGTTSVLLCQSPPRLILLRRARGSLSN